MESFTAYQSMEIDPRILAMVAATQEAEEVDYFVGTPLDDMRKLALMTEKERKQMSLQRRRELDARIANRGTSTTTQTDGAYEEEMRKFREQEKK